MDKIKIQDLNEFQFLSAPEFNDAGDWLAFVKTQADTEENCYRSDVWLYDVKGESTRRLTASEEVAGFSWLNDTTIIFTANRTDKDKEKAKKDDLTHVYQIGIHGGEAVKLFTIPAKASSLKMLDDHRCLFVMESDLRGKDLHSLKKEQDKAKEQKRREEEKDFEVYEEIPFWGNGRGFTAGKRGRLCHYDIKADKLTQLNRGKTSISGFSLNEEKTRALVLIRENKGVQELTAKLAELDLETLKLDPLKIGQKRFYDAQYLDDDTIFLLISDSEKYGLNENPRFYLLDRNAHELTAMVENQDISTGSSVNSDMRHGGGQDLYVKDGWIYYVETNDTDALLKRMDKDGSIEILIDEEGSVDCFDVSGEGRVIAVAMEPAGLQELYEMADRSRIRRTEFNQEYLKDRQVQIPENIRVAGEGADIVNGFVLKPADYKKGRKYPGILVIHGGPKTVYGSVFVHEMQVWASMGYFVFFCNPKGSDGKGNEFADIRGRYGTVDYDNLMAFTDKVLDTYPDIDEDRLGVTGGSYGGFMTNWIIGHNQNFKAAASQRSISNWLSFFGTSDIGYYFATDQNGAWPWKNAEDMWNQSPLKYADQATTPTLFIHSDQDYRCWLPEAYQMFTALKLHGCDARMVEFHGETHELSRSGKPKSRIRRLTEITDWFEKYLREK